MTEATSTQRPAQLVKDYIRHTMGTENYYKHWSGLLYTDGVRFVAQTVGAYWLIDLIASWQIKKTVQVQPFQVWQLTKEYSKRYNRDEWVARCWTDTPDKSQCVAVQHIEYSDFPDELLPFKLWMEYGVLILPEEH